MTIENEKKTELGDGDDNTLNQATETLIQAGEIFEQQTSDIDEKEIIKLVQEVLEEVISCIDESNEKNYGETWRDVDGDDNTLNQATKNTDSSW